MKLSRPVSAISAGNINSIVLSTCTRGRGKRLLESRAVGVIGLAAVQSGQVSAAGLDSIAIEPMPMPHPFRGEPRIVLSPHIGGVTADAYVKMGVAAARNALAVLNS